MRIYIESSSFTIQNVKFSIYLQCILLYFYINLYFIPVAQQLYKINLKSLLAVQYYVV